MKKFQQFLEEKDGLADMNFSGTSPNDILVRMAKIAIDDHLKDLLSFYEHLAKKSSRLRNELNVYKQDQLSGVGKRIPKDHLPINGDDKDIVVPHSADTGVNSED